VTNHGYHFAFRIQSSFDQDLINYNVVHFQSIWPGPNFRKKSALSFLTSSLDKWRRISVKINYGCNANFLIYQHLFAQKRETSSKIYFCNGTTWFSQSPQIWKFDIKSDLNEQIIIRNGDESISHYQMIIERYLVQRAWLFIIAPALLLALFYPDLFHSEKRSIVR